MAPESNAAEATSTAFQEQYGYPPWCLFRAPGRFNLIGEHTDYNDGFVLPMAIDRAIWVAAARRDDRQVRLVAHTLGREATFALDGLQPGRNKHWSNYVRGVLALLDRAGHPLGGLDLAYGGNLPIGAGLSSSAAVEVAIGFAASTLFSIDLPALELAALCQKAEQEFVGTQCGIMDQLISVLGMEDHALLIDCRHLTWQAAPLPDDTAVVVCDTNKRRGLANSAYNERRAQCEEAAQRLGLASLRDLDLENFEAQAGRLPPLLRKRCRHVVYENDRTLRAAAVLRQRDVAAFGLLMNESHASLRDDYEVSCDELDVMAALAQSQPGCWGARMTGAGFGGSVAALVDRRATDAFVETVSALYKRHARRIAKLYVCHPSAGAGPI